MHKFIIGLVTLVLISSSTVYSKSIEIPADLTGPQELKTWLKKTTHLGKIKVKSYKKARHLMYNYIDNVDDQIIGVYSGYKIDWDYGSKSNNPYPINCEHTVPQSFFKARAPMKSDLHHIFPTFNKWNTYRSNSPYGDIDDSKTLKWFRGDNFSEDIPESDVIDEYSEYSKRRFEPRESHKGNVARAIFYFYTMYENRVRPLSQLADVETLLRWHKLDPVDEAELRRNDLIEEHQGNRNPYIDNADLAAKVWGQNK